MIMSDWKYKTMDKDGDWWLWKNRPVIDVRDNVVWRCSGCDNGVVLNVVNQLKQPCHKDWTVGFYSATGFDYVTGIPLVNDVVTFQGEPESDSDKQKRVQSLEYTETSSQLSCVDELFNLIGDKNVSVSFDCGGQDKTITIVDSDGKTYLATSVEELKEILSAIDTLTKYYYAQ
jgi:hypothetical protein